MRGGDHTKRAARIFCRQYGIPPSLWWRVVGNPRVEWTALGLALRDLKIEFLRALGSRS